MIRLFKTDVPCRDPQCQGQGELPPCLRSNPDAGQAQCPASIRLRDTLERIKGGVYRGGYSFVAWVVLTGPTCELVCFQNEPDAEELRQRFGDKLLKIVPV
jgi:hypothetical protein